MVEEQTAKTTCVVARSVRRFFFFGRREQYLQYLQTPIGKVRGWVNSKDKATTFENYEAACKNAHRDRNEFVTYGPQP